MFHNLKYLISLFGIFAYLSAEAQVLNSLDIQQAKPGESLTVKLTATGTKFTQSSGTINRAWLNKGGDEIEFENMVALDDEMLQVDIVIPCDADTGYWDLYTTAIDATYYDTLELKGALRVFDPLQLNIVAVKNAQCGWPNGEATVQAVGGTAPYSYLWTTGDETTTAADLPADFYQAIVTDVNGCKSYNVVNVSIQTLDIQVDRVKPVSCYQGNDGEIDITVTGGIAPYAYDWSHGSSMEDIIGLPACAYELYVTDAVGCTGTIIVEVTQPKPLSLTITTKKASCASADGSASVYVTGGTAPYTYKWSSGGNAATENKLVTGIYTVNITDALGCTAQEIATVSEKEGPVVRVDSISSALCGNSNGKIYISTSGGTKPYFYKWSNGANTEDLLNVAPDDYTLEVTGYNGCKAYFQTELSSVKPEGIELCLVTVDTATKTNLLVWNKSKATGIKEYKIYKACSPGSYGLIGTVPHSSDGVFTDPLANPDNRSWNYKISVVDNCGNESEMSDNHETMHLSVFDDGSGKYHVKWNHYKGFPVHGFII